eukprot:TRINITY_DN61038_c0_g1_i1.p1 TRINITY_DN61038_c0_g1~~TRINITY_DN61038_c0_g1_i1.p1  ORF type:complete len:426 (+),score=107.60 TRINITY_DN61038_c0_g1_i1:72-1280(+)
MFPRRCIPAAGALPLMLQLALQLPPARGDAFEEAVRATWESVDEAMHGSPEDRARDFFARAPPRPAHHTNNWAVIVDTSRFWGNYRHVANALTIYHLVKKLGIPDSHILLMLGDDVPCNPRNTYPATVYNNRQKDVNLYGEDVEVDYRGYEVTVEAFMRLLTGRHPVSFPHSKRLHTDTASNVLIYMSGHGGDEFLKFQDAAEVNSQDLADAFAQMWTMGRYHSLLFMVETCQAATLLNRFHAPNLIGIGSSLKGENSYSHHNDEDLGLAVMDRWTYYALEYLRPLGQNSTKTLLDFFETFTFAKLNSHVWWTSTHPVPLRKLRITDFFSTQLRVERAPRSTSGALPSVGAAPGARPRAAPRAPAVAQLAPADGLPARLGAAALLGLLALAGGADAALRLRR